MSEREQTEAFLRETLKVAQAAAREFAIVCRMVAGCDDLHGTLLEVAAKQALFLYPGFGEDDR